MKIGHKIAIALTILIISLSLISSLKSCSMVIDDDLLNEITLGVWDCYLLDESVHNVVEYIDDGTVKYQGNTYYLAPMIFFDDNSTSIQQKRCYEYIGWTGPRYFYHNTFYGDCKDAPNIIYEVRSRYTYIREDYDYKTDPFRINGTEDHICFSDSLIEHSDPSVYDGAYNSSNKYIVLSSSTHPSLDIKLGIFEDNGNWYAYSKDFVYFKLSENFVGILVKNQIIS